MVPIPRQNPINSVTETLPTPARVIQSRTRLRRWCADPGRRAPVTPSTSRSTPATSRLGIATMTGSLMGSPFSCAEHLTKVDAGGGEPLLVGRIAAGPQQLSCYLAEQWLRLDLSPVDPTRHREDLFDLTASVAIAPQEDDQIDSSRHRRHDEPVRNVLPRQQWQGGQLVERLSRGA